MQTAQWRTKTGSNSGEENILHLPSQKAGADNPSGDPSPQARKISQMTPLV